MTVAGIIHCIDIWCYLGECVADALVLDLGYSSQIIVPNLGYP